ncbi:MAG: hypothetical protein Q8L79_04110 [Methylobacter sp.]|uniref:hypothetical protein n=1 Tax=Methylobacter sp. TaxID=2051955 RepID=UPI00272FED5F|nr:hypothetical protein [Methylobacter sp.]MDP1664289.1 hypothetical protein [Methylobacter sp.]
MNLRTAICPRKARKTRKFIGRDFRVQCRSGFLTNRHKLIYAITMKSMKDKKTSILHAFHVLHGLKIKLAQVISCTFLSEIFALVPKLLLGNPVSEAPASRVGKLELPRLHSQAGAWERAKKARKTRKVIGRNFRAQCRSGFATPTETFQGLNRLRNVNDGVANPVTLSESFVDKKL